MDFSKFIFSKRYLRHDKELELFFDFDLMEFTGRNSKTFDDYQSLLHFLENNPEKKVFITRTEVADFFEEDNNIVINIISYQEFCKKIGQSGKNRTQAYLAQRIKHYSADDKQRIIADSTAEEIIKNLGQEKLEVIIGKIKSIDSPEIVDKGKVIVVNDNNKKQIIEQILEGGYSEDFWDLISSKDPELTDRLSAGRVQAYRRKVVDELKERLTKDFAETSGDDSWQRWIYAHNWLFGTNYQKPIEKQKINITGVMPDYLFPTLDGFVDILEIKLPSFEVIEEDAGHAGSWVWSEKTNYAIGQVVNYLSEIDRLKLEIEREIEIKYHKKVSMLKPRAFILIGKNDGWDIPKREGLRKLNHVLHGVEVLTYSDLVRRGEIYVELSTDDHEKVGQDSERDK